MVLKCLASDYLLVAKEKKNRNPRVVVTSYVSIGNA